MSYLVLVLVIRLEAVRLNKLLKKLFIQEQLLLAKHGFVVSVTHILTSITLPYVLQCKYFKTAKDNISCTPKYYSIMILR